MTITSFGPQLVRVVFWIAVACCVVAQGAILRSALRPPGGVEGVTGSTTVPRANRASEITWTLIPAAVLAVVLSFTWQAIAR